MSSWPEYDDMSLSKKEIWEQKMQTKKRKKLFEESMESRRFARQLESYDQFVAAKAYRELRAKRKYAAIADIALYANDKLIKIN